MQKLKVLFQNNKEWVESKISKDPKYFRRMADDKRPSYLWIGCSDSRVPANENRPVWNRGSSSSTRNVANPISPYRF